VELLYHKGDFASARAAFEKLPQTGKMIPPLARCFIARCEMLVHDPPKMDWDGVWDFANK
jgi:hypothetical protein